MVNMSLGVCMIEMDASPHCTGIRLVKAPDTTTVQELKTQLDSRLPYKILCLLYRGCPIQWNTTLEECCPASLSCPRFTALYTLDSHNHVLIKTLTGETYTVTANLATADIAEIKQAVFIITGIPADKQLLIFNHKECMPTDTLTDLNIQHNSKLYLIIESKKQPCSVDIADGTELQTISMLHGANARDWRHCYRGLNLEGRCVNSYCQAYQRLVVAHCYELFLPSMDSMYYQAMCPMCRSEFTPETFGFSGCLWAYDSCQRGDNRQTVDISSSWQKVPVDKFQRFTYDTTEWEVLRFSVKASFSSSDLSGLLPCPVCHLVPQQETALTASCGHSFHPSCLAAWKRWKPKDGCPDCKATLHVQGGEAGNVTAKDADGHDHVLVQSLADALQTTE